MTALMWSIWETVVTLFECSVSTKFVCSFLGQNTKHKQGIKIWLGMALSFATAVTVFNHVMLYEGVFDFVYILIVFLYSVAFLPGTFLQKGFVSVFFLCCIVMNSSFGANLVSNLTKSDLATIYGSNGLPRFLATLFVQLLNLLVFQLLTRLFGKGAVKLRKSEWAMLGGVFSFSIIAMVIVQLASMRIETANKVSLMFLCIDMTIMIVDYITVRLIVSLNRSYQTKLENEQLRMQMQYQTQYAETVRQQEASVHRLRHDFKATVAVLHDFIQENNTEEMKAYLNTYATALAETASIVRTNQPFLNAILNTKLTYAKEHGIQCTCHTPRKLPNFPGEDYCSLFGNLLDNAIEAELSDHIFEPELRINIDYRDDQMIIMIGNRIHKSVLSSNHALRSTKQHSEQHGFGIPTIREIAMRYHGSVEFYEDEGFFVALVVIPSS